MYWIPFAAFGTCLVLHLLSLKLFPAMGLLDFPERYGLTRKRLPYPTGILAVFTFLGFFAYLQTWNMQSIGLMLSIVILTCINFLDDRIQIPALIRLLVQLLIAFLIFATGTRIYTLTNPLDGFLSMPDLIKLDTKDILTGMFGPLPLYSGIFTIVWLGLTMNALNWFDGIRGQVSTISIIGFLVIGFLSMSDRVTQPELAQIAFILAGIALAGLLFDFPPGRVLMGDTGSMFFGLMLGVLTIYTGGKVATAFLVLGVPLIDSAIVVARRIMKGKSIMKGDTKNEHLHHRLLTKGWSKQSIVFLTALLGTGFGITALFLSTQGKFIAAIVLFLVMLGLSWYSRPNRK